MLKKYMSRIQIRQGTFETNSSSTHSIQLANCDNAIEIIQKAIIECMPKAENDVWDGYSNIVDGTLYLKGFNEEESDENKLVCYVITQPLVKIQYLFGLLWQYIEAISTYTPIKIQNKNEMSFDENGNKTYYSTFDGYIYGDTFYRKNNEYLLDKSSFTKKTKEYQTFEKLVMNYINENKQLFHETINEIDIDDEDSIYIPNSYTELDEEKWNWNNIFSDVEVFTDRFNEIMDNTKSIILMDKPYHPFYSPYCKIY